MAITMRDFAPAMGFLCEMLPMQRALSDEALAMAWETMPNSAKIHLTQESLAFAVKQRLVDPAPPKEQALHIALLRYVFPVERTVRRERGEDAISDRVLLENGPRADLRERIQEPDRFHDPAPVREDLQPARERAPRLPAGGAWHPSMMTGEQRYAHVCRVEARMEQILAAGPDDRAWTASQLEQGLWWFERALQGFWPLEADKGGVAAAWVRSNPQRARAMVERALTLDVEVVAPGAGLAVGGILGGIGA